MNELKTVVWERIGMLGNEPGLLTLSQDRISLETDRGVRFSCLVSDLTEVKWPWYSFNAALNLKAQAQKFRISFARPNGVGHGAVAGLRGATDLLGAVKAGKSWRQALQASGG
jgi:hypothetical protein